MNSFSEQTMAEMPPSTRDLFTVCLRVQGIRRNTTRAYLLENTPSTFARAKVVALKFEELLEKGIVDKSKYLPSCARRQAGNGEVESEQRAMC